MKVHSDDGVCFFQTSGVGDWIPLATAARRVSYAPLYDVILMTRFSVPKLPVGVCPKMAVCG